MIKINNYSIVHWVDQGRWFICFPDGFGISIPDSYSLRIVLIHVLFWLSRGCKSMSEI